MEDIESAGGKAQSNLIICCPNQDTNECERECCYCLLQGKPSKPEHVIILLKELAQVHVAFISGIATF